MQIMAKKQTKPNVTELIEGILAEAVQFGASDIHFEPTGIEILVKYRLDGRLRIVDRLPVSMHENLVARLKVLANLLTYRNDIPQEGRIEGGKNNGSEIKVTDKRLAVFPTIHGQRAVVRIFYENRDLMKLGRLGFAPDIEKALGEFTQKQEGILLLTGPAGSGKSTTLAALLGAILERFPDKSIVALEDPVERVIEGVTQVQIEPHREMTFPVALRSLLRQDPEVLMIGEIRDAQTARIVIEAGLTGHLMMSTMHSGSCAGALIRLLEMGIEPYQLTSGIWGVVNQRLVRRLCEKCRQEARDGGFDPGGCNFCHNTGYHGRVLLAEMVRMDSEIRKHVLGRCDLESLEELLDETGRRGLNEAGRRLVTEGVTSRSEIVRVCG